MPLSLARQRSPIPHRYATDPTVALLIRSLMRCRTQVLLCTNPLSNTSTASLPPAFAKARAPRSRSASLAHARSTATSVDNGLGRATPRPAVLEVCRLSACEVACWIWSWITQRAYQAAEIIATGAILLSVPVCTPSRVLCFLILHVYGWWISDPVVFLFPT